MKINLFQYFNISIFIFLSTSISGQTVPVTNIQQQVVFGILEGSSTADPNFYQWNQVSTALQGVIVSLEPTEVKPLFLQKDDCKLQFANGQLVFKLDIKFDNGAFINIYEGNGRTNIGWITPPESFLSLGEHKLFVKFLVGQQILAREYNVFVVPSPQHLFADNTQVVTSQWLAPGNTIALWDNPNCSDAEPILLSEGYDATNSVFPQFYRFRGKELIERLFERGYKVYILNYNLANQDLKNNAAVYNSAIRYISSINKNKDVMAVGISMGGLIARFALSKAEAEHAPLPVSAYISLDAPHQGAEVDIDFQQFVRDKTPTPPASMLTTASKQLLVHHAFDANQTFFLDFQNQLNTINGNGYPKRVVNIGAAFSRDVPNPNMNSTWLEIDARSLGISLRNGTFTVKNEWAVAGSFLPTASTNIETNARPAWLGYLGLGFFPAGLLFTELNTTISRSSHPTFIPYRSALNLDASGRAFDIKMEQIETRPSFHDEIPQSVIDQLIKVIGSDVTNIAANETFNFTALKGRFIRNDIQVWGNMSVNKDLPSGSSLNQTLEPKLNVPLHKLFTAPCRAVTISIENGGHLNMSDIHNNEPFNSIIALKSGDVLHVKTGASLTLNQTSTLFIGDAQN